MAGSATIRDLRNRFPKVRKLVESEGEVLLTERGKTRYRLTLYAAPPAAKQPPAKDYLARMKRHQRRPLRRAAARALAEENRGRR
jgi:antitoxin (DNA-binding transcriptional repressor) of toxin-antitoxin stability system